MQTGTDIRAEFDDLRALFEKHLGVRAPTVKAAVRRAGRRLPRGMRAQAAVLVEAEALAAHPKLERRIDRARTAAAYATLRDYLRTQDLAKERATRRINTAVVVVFNLLVIAAGLIVVLRWRGFV